MRLGFSAKTNSAQKPLPTAEELAAAERDVAAAEGQWQAAVQVVANAQARRLETHRVLAVARQRAHSIRHDIEERAKFADIDPDLLNEVDRLEASLAAKGLELATVKNRWVRGVSVANSRTDKTPEVLDSRKAAVDARAEVNRLEFEWEALSVRLLSLQAYRDQLSRDPLLRARVQKQRNSAIEADQALESRIGRMVDYALGRH